jgi:hypothetical protein
MNSLSQINQQPQDPPEQIVTGKKGDRFCKVAIALGALYVLYLAVQAFVWWKLVRP